MTENPFQQFVRYIRDSHAILVFTGAGVSTGSGIPDFRGPKGIWQTNTPVFYQDFMKSEEQRIKYWKQKLEGWEKYRDAAPNDAHRAVVHLDKANKLLLLVTQNIDGLHTRAGLLPSLVVELHGTMNAVECQSCGRRREPGPVFAEFKKTTTPPLCTCGGFLKPATISFGQNLREQDLERAFEAASGADLVISLGSTLSVTPAASVPLHAAMHGTPYVIVNRGPTEHDGLREVSLRLDGDVCTVFPRAVDEALSN
jgi:NAD-dependent deacetylase